MTQETVTAINRFGLGARPGELAEMREPRAWLLQQLAQPAGSIDYQTEVGNSADVLGRVFETRRQRREMQQAGKSPGNDYARLVRRHYADQVLTRYREACLTEQPFRERLVHFFANHFAISADKQPLPAIAGLFEWEAIRPNVTGRFADLLLAVERHPAMLVYLDNQRSIGPKSRAAEGMQRRRPDANAGLNENLAREILELHTLGVDGGYSQADVSGLARMITGWSVASERDQRRDSDVEIGEFYFRRFAHEPGSQTLLGSKFQDQGVRQGEKALEMLATHPATARHVSTKLARHFIHDDPPPDVVNNMVRRWTETDGDLASVIGSMVEHDASWSPDHRKYKSPHDYVISTFRALGSAPDSARVLFTTLDHLGQVPWRPGSPAGWPDTQEDWGSPDALYKRIEWAGGISRIAGRRLDPVSLADDVLGSSMSVKTRQSVKRAESTEQAVTLLFASPDFLRR